MMPPSQILLIVLSSFVVALAGLLRRQVGRGGQLVFLAGGLGVGLLLTGHSFAQLIAFKLPRIGFQLAPFLSIRSEGQFGQSILTSWNLVFDPLAAFFLLLSFAYSVHLLLFEVLKPADHGSNAASAAGPSRRFSQLAWLLPLSTLALLVDQLLLAALFFFLFSYLNAAGLRVSVRRRHICFDLLLVCGMGLLAYYGGRFDYLGFPSIALDHPVRIWPLAQDVPIARVLSPETRDLLLTERFVNARSLVGFFLVLGLASRGISSAFAFTAHATESSRRERLVESFFPLLLCIYLLIRVLPLLSDANEFLLALQGASLALFASYQTLRSQSKSQLVGHLLALWFALLLLALALGQTQLVLAMTLVIALLLLSLLLNPGVPALLFASALPPGVSFFSLVALATALLASKSQLAAAVVHGRRSVAAFQWPSLSQPLLLVVVLAAALALGASCARVKFRGLLASKESPATWSPWGRVFSAVTTLAGGLSAAIYAPVFGWSCLALFSSPPGAQVPFFAPAADRAADALLAMSLALVAGVAWVRFDEVSQGRWRKKIARCHLAMSALWPTQLSVAGVRKQWENALDSLAELVDSFDRLLVRRLVVELPALLSALVALLLRRLHAGRISGFHVLSLVFALALFYSLLGPTAQVNVQADDRRGVYRIIPSKSFGTRYRYDLDADGRWDEEVAGEVEFLLEPLTSKKVLVEVESVLGLKRVIELNVERPFVESPLPAYNKWENTPRTSAPSSGSVEPSSAGAAPASDSAAPVDDVAPTEVAPGDVTPAESAPERKEESVQIVLDGRTGKRIPPANPQPSQNPPLHPEASQNSKEGEQ